MGVLRRLRPGIVLCVVLAARAPAVAGETYQIYFGELHAHTGYSDGQQTPQVAFEHAKNSGRGDFIALTDHVEQLSDAEWADTRAMADAYTDATFVCMAGFEYTKGWGHMNAFDIDWVYRPNDTIPGWYDRLAGDGTAIGHWNHPSWYDHFDNFGHYTQERDAAVSLIETNAEFYSYYVQALDAGWHVGPTATSDTHSANWLTGTDRRTGILATTLTRAAIYDALRNMRVYATQDRNLRITYTVNGSVMGSTAPYALAYDVAAHVQDPDSGDANDKIVSIELITNGGAVAAGSSHDGHTADWALTVPSSSAGSFYFLRVTNAGGQLAFTAPVWVPPGPPDTDSDGLPDPWEIAHFGDLTVSDGSSDSDGDGLVDLGEYQTLTDPNDADSDDDGLDDGEEIATYLTDPTDADSDSDGMGDGWEVANGLSPDDASDGSADPDDDGYSNVEEFLGGSDPHDLDSTPSGSSGQLSLSCTAGAGGADLTLLSVILAAALLRRRAS